MEPLNEYLKNIQATLAAGHASEGSHYPAMKTLIESLEKGLTATSLPSRIECGAPDFVITRGVLTVGYVEAKDIGKSLDEVEKTEQLERYLGSLTNLILTDYLEFRWYVDGKLCLKARLSTPVKDGKIKLDKGGAAAVAELLGAFLSHKAEGVGTPKDLALRMASLAHMMRSLTIASFEKEAEKGNLHGQLKAFRDNLIPDLSVEQFADMYAQTITYGLFAARCASPDVKGFTRFDAAKDLPKTNPLLRGLFQHLAGYDLDERISWLVDDLSQILDQADMPAVLKDFGKHTAKEDPVVHFYETFLTAYDPKVREMRGIYYTPEPVVSYIVRSVDYLLKTRFGKPEGLADKDTLILDPAVGTATFLYLVINEIHDTFVKQGQTGLWDKYVAGNLLPRIFGFEILMAPYAVAHLKLGILLRETGYQFQSDERLKVYLTNTLEEAVKSADTLFAQYISDEANAAAEVKKEKPILVVLGNPPYSKISANVSNHVIFDSKTNKYRREFTWIGKLIEDYKIVDGHSINERKDWLQNDYVKFIRFGQWRIEKTEKGILAFITDHGYLDNPTFRGMRQSLLNSFTDIYILNLHGNVNKRETAPDGSKDENVFDIQQGVAIGVFIKEPEKNSPAKVHYADLWGLKGSWPNPEENTKYHVLLENYMQNMDWKDLKPSSPFYFFIPREEELLPEYEKGWKITDIFRIRSTGVYTSKDHFVVDFETKPIENRIRMYRDEKIEDSEIKEKLLLSENYAWRISDSRKQLMKVDNWESYFTNILFRPFDIRSIFYHSSVVWRTRTEIMQHMLDGTNLGLLSARSNKTSEMNHFFCSRNITELKCGEYSVGSYLFPLYLLTVKDAEKPNKIANKESGTQTMINLHPKREPNLRLEFIKVFSEKLGLKFVEDGKGDLKETFGPEDIFNYAYAIFHSPTYRTRYAEFLKVDFPRLPLTSNKTLFKVLAEKGAELVALHLMESPALSNYITKFPVSGSGIVEKVTYKEAEKRVYINKTQYFEGVPPEVWNFHIGGYQVCDKWLKDRQKVNRKLTIDEAQHYQKMVVAIKETARLMAEIDALIPGWPME